MWDIEHGAEACGLRRSQQQQEPAWHALSPQQRLTGSMHGLGMEDDQQNGLPSHTMAPLRSRCVPWTSSCRLGIIAAPQSMCATGIMRWQQMRQMKRTERCCQLLPQESQGRGATLSLMQWSVGAECVPACLSLIPECISCVTVLYKQSCCWHCDGSQPHGGDGS